MNKNEHMNHWLKNAEHDLDTAESMFASGKYDWCLFIGHLVLEKALKAIYVYKNDNKIPPKTHNLLYLARKSGVKLSSEQEFFFSKVNDFNIEVRYPQYKHEFYKQCTKKFTELNFLKIKEHYQWLKSQIK